MGRSSGTRPRSFCGLASGRVFPAMACSLVSSIRPLMSPGTLRPVGAGCARSAPGKASSDTPTARQKAWDPRLLDIVFLLRTSLHDGQRRRTPFGRLTSCPKNLKAQGWDGGPIPALAGTGQSRTRRRTTGRQDWLPGRAWPQCRHRNRARSGIRPRTPPARP